MFHTAVPISLSTIPDDGSKAHVYQLLDNIKKIGASHVFLCLQLPQKLDIQCQKVNQVSTIFQSAGIKTGIWIGSFCHVTYDNMGFTPMVDLSGDEIETLTCPSDMRFVQYYCSLVTKLACCKISMLVLDDDFRINFNGRKPLCFCRKHLQYMEQKLGESVARKHLQNVILNGMPNRYRTAWMSANQHFLKAFSIAIRDAVDCVNPELPVILCSGPASWGVDGSDLLEITQILAGKCPVSMRLSGGPYWPIFFPTLKLANIIDLVRNEAAYCSKNGISVFAEGDTYPRPCYEVPASQLELFELACRADGNMAGILKYVFDYVACLPYETRYIDTTAQNRKLYYTVEHAFSGKKTAGISIFTPFTFSKNFRGSVSEPFPDMETKFVQTAAIRMLNDNSIPSHFEPDGVGIVFGSDAEELPLERLKDGWILDLPAAKRLSARGVDTGIQNDLGIFDTSQAKSHLLYENPYLLHMNNSEFCPVTNPDIHRLILKPSAEIVSTYTHGTLCCPGEYRYENKNHQRFFVFPFDASSHQHKIGMFRNYYRQRELIDAYRWLCGTAIDAVCPGHPDLYLMVKKNTTQLTVGLWNFSLDAIETPVIILSKSYSQLQTIRCTGKLSGDRVTLSRLGAQEFCCFTVQINNSETKVNYR